MRYLNLSLIRDKDWTLQAQVQIESFQFEMACMIFQVAQAQIVNDQVELKLF